MKKVININFQGQVIAIEETAYEILEQYIGSLKSYFSQEEGGDEIVNDIESRIAELFGNRLKHGINCITDEDVNAVIESIGRPQEFDSDYEETTVSGESPQAEYAGSPNSEPHPVESERKGLRRNANDRIIGGVCSGLAHYFQTDPVWIRLLFVLFFGILFWVYIVLWIVLKQEPLESNVSKRIYRNPNDRIIGGVCGGIAAYFRIDAWIPRVLFLLPLILNMIGMVSIFPLNRIINQVGFDWNFNMSMVLVYVVLWAVIPQAKTVKQKLEMMGEEDYIRSIREKVTDNVASSRSRAENEGAARAAKRGNVSHFAKVDHEAEVKVDDQVDDKVDDTEGKIALGEMPPEPPVSARRVETAPAGSGRSGCLNAFVVFLKIILFAFVGIMLLSLVGIFVGLLLAGTQLTPLKSLFIDPGYETHLLYASLGLIFLVPCIAVVIWIVRRSMKAKSRPAIGIVASLLWIVGLTLTGILSARVADKFRVESTSERTVVLTPVASTKMYLEMQPYYEDYGKIRTGYGPGVGIDQLPHINIEEDSLLFDNINLQIGKSSDSLFHVRVISAIRGKDLRTTKEEISRFSYEIAQKDSLLFLPEFLTVPADQGFRDQSITVQVSVPAGKTIEMSEALKEYKDNRPPAVVRKRISNSSQNTTYLPVDVSGEAGVATAFPADSI